MKKTAEIPPDYYADLDKLAERIGSSDSEAEQDKQATQKRLLLYSVPQLLDYLEQTCPPMEVKRQKLVKLLFAYKCYVNSCMVLIVAFLLCHYCLKINLLPPAVMPFISISIPALMMCINCNPINMAKARGLCWMILEYAQVKQVPLLIYMLPFAAKRHIAQQKLTLFLPTYLKQDKPPLEDPLKQILVRELKKGFVALGKQQDRAQIDDEVSFLAAVLIYFEQELAYNRSLPKNTLPVLKQFVDAPAAKQIPTAQWTMLQSTAQECLVGAQRK